VIAELRSRARRWSGWPDAGWGVLAVVVVWAAWLVPLFQNDRRYFRGDTEVAYYGWWYHFGDSLRSGEWPMLDVSAWPASNLLAEGQTGLYNPLVALIGLGATVAPNVVWYATLVKFVVVAIGVLGVVALARSYGVRPPLAAAAGVAVPLSGFTLGYDAPSWFAGLLVCSLLPWAWWGLRRILLRTGGPLPALMAGYLLVTTGYVYGTIYLAVIVVGCLVEAAVHGDRRSAGRILLFGGYAGLVAVAVYLPGVLTAPVTTRDGWHAGGDGPLRMQPSAYLFAGHPTTVIDGVLPEGARAEREKIPPFSYVAWFLPLVTWLRLGVLRERWRDLVGLGLLLVVTLVWTLGPYNLGPLRWPARVMPVVSLALVLLVIVLVDRCLDRAPTTARLVIGLAWVGLAGVMAAASGTPSWQLQAVTTGLVAALVALAWLLARRRQPGEHRLLGGVLVAGSLLLATYTLHVLPETKANSAQLPVARTDYRPQLADARGEVLVIGPKPRTFAPSEDRARTLLGGNAWYLNDHEVRNHYTAAGFGRYNRWLQVKPNGLYAPETLDRLLAREPMTGMRHLDLQAVGTLVIATESKTLVRRTPPTGWHEVSRDRYAAIWVRDAPVPGSGGVVWSSLGTVVRQVQTSDTEVSFVVDSVPDSGGSVVLSRLAWPGYRVDGGELDEPLEDYLLRVKVPADAAGRTVRVTFRPPQWELELAALAAALVIGASWAVGEPLLRRRARRRVDAGH
jgi:hypothetical protein